MERDELRQIAVFADLAEPNLERLRAVLSEERFADRQTIFAEGDEGNAVFFIREGHARVEKLVQAGATETKTLAIMGPGDFFGEMSLFDGKPRSASTLAMGPLRVYRLTRADFQALLTEDQAAAAGVLFAVIKTCHQRIRSLNSKVVAFHEIGKAIGEASNLRQLAEVVLTQLREATGATRALLAVQLEFYDRLEVVAQSGPDWPRSTAEAIGRREGLLGRVVAERRSLLVEDFGKDELSRGAAQAGYETASMILEPVWVRDQFLGVLLLGHEGPRRFTLDDSNLCSSVASQVAQAILDFRHREEEQGRSKLGRQYVRF